MISRLRHQGPPSLQAQKWVSTVKKTASARVIGTTFSMVVPNITRISSGRPDMVTSSIREVQGLTPGQLRRRELARTSAKPHLYTPQENHAPIVTNPLKRNLLCPRTGTLRAFCTAELTAPQLSILRVTPWS